MRWSLFCISWTRYCLTACRIASPAWTSSSVSTRTAWKIFAGLCLVSFSKDAIQRAEINFGPLIPFRDCERRKRDKKKAAIALQPKEITLKLNEYLTRNYKGNGLQLYAKYLSTYLLVSVVFLLDRWLKNTQFWGSNTIRLRLGQG